MPSTLAFLENLLKPFIGEWFYADSNWWTMFGFIGGGLFSARFLIQWLTTEKHRRLIVPPAFWHCSFWGSVINTVYLLHVDKAPLILMNFFLPFLYLRNLIYLGRSAEKTLRG